MSETPREYKDWDGNPIALSKLVRLEPGWAVAQIMHRDQLERELATVTREMDLAADQLKGTCSLNRLLREEKDKLARERDGFKARVQEFDDAMCDEISHHIDTREERDTARAELAAVTAQRDAAKEEIECLKRELGSFKRRAWSAESMLETRHGLRREIAEALGVSAETGDDALRVGLETIRNLVQERDALIAKHTPDAGAKEGA